MGIVQVVKIVELRQKAVTKDQVVGAMERGMVSYTKAIPDAEVGLSRECFSRRL